MLDKLLGIGEVFTPLKWAKWLIDKWDIFDAWIDGAHICDPTAGKGAFILALLDIARCRGVPITPERLSRLTLIEMNASHLAWFRKKVKQEFGVDFPVSQLFCQDVIIESHAGKYDILIGNPPWMNFADLPSDYKTRVKPSFLAEGLVPDRQQLLLGSSRIDIAALVLKIALGQFLKENGVGYFYLPLSLFFGDGAHSGFRNYRANQRNFAVDTVYEFTSTQVFEGIGTSYGCAKFQCDTFQTFPIPYFRESDGNWTEHKAVPLNDSADPWRVVRGLNELNTGTTVDLNLSPTQTPRQGVNTCGANSVFIFQDKPSHLPEAFLYPLATKEIWRQDTSIPHKWILLPYHRETGKPLTQHQIEQHSPLKEYLCNAEETLRFRKGTLLKTTIDRGYWWALFGVGTYSFAPFKVMWEAYGRSRFNPVVLSCVDGQAWQGNQSMHAFIPCWSEDAARRIKSELENPEIPTLLRQLNGAGKCNWAQPGKMRKILFRG
ncbi:SAM-dependent DNA methyltransferase [Candidatus Poribacteria bacterium]|nr:SAM-dependent DNA methyltransferase [Candidatus Poribacteria bacterium]